MKNRKFGIGWFGAHALVASIALVAVSSTAFAGTVTLTAPLDSRTATTQESSFGNLFADAILAAAPGADFSIAPAAELRPILIPSGKTTTEHVSEALRASTDPGDTVVVMKLTGAQVIAALAHGVSRSPSPFDGMLEVSGLNLHYDSSRTGDARIVSATVVPSAETVQPKSTYRVAMPKYLADGALGFFAIWSKAGAPIDTGTAVTSAVQSYLTSHQPVSAQVDGRISGS